MKQGRKNWIWLAGMALLPLAGISQNTSLPMKHELTVKDAVDYAKKNSVQVKNALVDVQIQEQTNKEITAAAYPQITGNINSTYNPNIATQSFPNFISAATYAVLQQEDVRKGNGNAIVPPADFGLIQAQFGTKWVAGAGVDLSQLLFDGQVFVGLKARKTSIEFSNKNVEVTVEVIKANIYKIYYQLVASKTQIELLDANLQRLEKLLHDTREIYKNGFAEKLDVDKVSVQMANLETERQKTLSGITNGYYGLKLLLGMPIKDTLVLTDTLSDEQIKDGVLENSAYNYSDRKEYQYTELLRKLNEYNIKRYQMSRIPTVTLSGGYSKNAQRNKFNFFQGQYFTFSNIGLRVNIPIFNGFATNARVQKARLQLQETNNQLDNLKNSIDNEVVQAQTNFKSAIAVLDYQKRNMSLAETVYEQTKKKYEAGTGSNLEITSAQTDLKTAQTNYITSLYDAIVAKIDFLKATGKL